MDFRIRQTSTASPAEPGGLPTLSSTLWRIPDAVSNVAALRELFRVTERAAFEWIVSRGSADEAVAKRDSGHSRWLYDIAHHSEVCLESDGATEQSEALAARLEERQFGYLSIKDRRLIQDAVALRCDAFLTMERRLPRNAPHLARTIGLLVLNPAQHWEILRPWAALWI